MHKFKKCKKLAASLLACLGFLRLDTRLYILTVENDTSLHTLLTINNTKNVHIYLVKEFCNSYYIELLIHPRPRSSSESYMHSVNICCFLFSIIFFSS